MTAPLLLARGIRVQIWATLPLLVALFLTSCTSDDGHENDPTDDSGVPTANDESTATATANPDWTVVVEVSAGEIGVNGLGPAAVNARVALCLDAVRTESDYLLCDMPEAVKITTDSAGEFIAELAPTPYIGVGQRREVDCRSEDCAVAVLGVEDGGDPAAAPTEVLAVGAGPVEWPDSFPAPDAPVLQLESLILDPDAGTGSVHVEGEGFDPGSEVALVQCPSDGAGGVSAGDCLYDYGTFTVADETGAISVELTVYPLFQRSNGEYVECDGHQVTECWVGDPWPTPGSGNRYVMVPLIES